MLLAWDGSIKRNSYAKFEYLLRLEDSLVARRYFVVLKEQCSPPYSVPFLHCLLESIRYRLPIMGPRTAIFHRLLSSACKTPQETQDLSLPRKKLMNKTVKQWVVRANYPQTVRENTTSPSCFWCWYLPVVSVSQKMIHFFLPTCCYSSSYPLSPKDKMIYFT